MGMPMNSVLPIQVLTSDAGGPSHEWPEYGGPSAEEVAMEEAMLAHEMGWHASNTPDARDAYAAHVMAGLVDPGLAQALAREEW